VIPDNDIVKGYTANDTLGKVDYLDRGAGDYAQSLLSFYYTNTEIALRTGEIGCNVGISYDANGQTVTDALSIGTSFYIETPTVTSFTSVFASWDPAEDSVGVRPYLPGSSDYLALGGTPKGKDTKAGITWTANVAPPPVIGGGKIA